MSRLLLVEENAEQAEAILRVLAAVGFESRLAAGVSQALDLLDQFAPDVVLTDLLLPSLHGLELVEAVRAKNPTIPIVLITAQGNEELATEALRRGASSYVPRPRLAEDLSLTVHNLLSLTAARQRPARELASWTWSESHFILDNDPAEIPPLIGFLAENLRRLKFCDENDLIRVKVALSEALNNAMLHGNLEVSSALREREDDAYFRLAEERRLLAPYRDRRVRVLERELQDRVVYVIRDEGPGFDPSALPDPFDPENIGKTSGRGVMLIRTFMDEVRYNDVGNELTMVKKAHSC